MQVNGGINCKWKFLLIAVVVIMLAADAVAGPGFPRRVVGVPRGTNLMICPIFHWKLRKNEGMLALGANVAYAPHPDPPI